MAISKETQAKIDRFKAIRALLTEEELTSLANMTEYLHQGFNHPPETDLGLTVAVNIFDPEGIAETDPGFTEGANDNGEE